MAAKSVPADGHQVVIGSRRASIGLCDDASLVVFNGAAGHVDGDLDRLLAQSCLEAFGAFVRVQERVNPRDSLLHVVVLLLHREVIHVVDVGFRGSAGPAAVVHAVNELLNRQDDLRVALNNAK